MAAQRRRFSTAGKQQPTLCPQVLRKQKVQFGCTSGLTHTAPTCNQQSHVQPRSLDGCFS